MEKADGLPKLVKVGAQADPNSSPRISRTGIIQIRETQVKPLNVNLEIKLFPMANKWAPSEDDILKRGVESFSQGLDTNTPGLYTGYTKALQQ